MSKSIRISVEVDVHSVTCPGVWFPCKSPVYLSICFLGFHVKTKPFPAAFPLLFGDKFVFEKTFPGRFYQSFIGCRVSGPAEGGIPGVHPLFLGVRP